MEERELEAMVRDHEGLLRGAYGQEGLVRRVANLERSAVVRDAALTFLRWGLPILVTGCIGIATLIVLTR